jgi:hypothetical protein
MSASLKYLPHHFTRHTGAEQRFTDADCSTKLAGHVRQYRLDPGQETVAVKDMRKMLVNGPL